MERAQKATSKRNLFFFRLILVASAFGRAVNNFFPVFFPLLSPGKRPITDRTYFFRQIIFINHFHAIRLHFLVALYRMQAPATTLRRIALSDLQ